MPLGAARITLLAFQPSVAAEAEVIRRKIGITALSNTQINTAQSKFGGASATSGSNSDILECGSVVLPGQADYTVEFWFRLPNLTERRGFFGQYSSGAVGRTDAEFINQDGGYISFFQPPGSSFSEDYRIKSNSTISANTWHHCAITRDYGGNGHTMYIDGVAQTDTIADHSGTTQQIPLEIFSPQLGTVSTDYYMDEFRVSDIVRYTANFTPSTTPFQNDENTLLLLHMDGTDGSTLFEDDNGVAIKSSTGRTAISYTASGDAQVSTTESKFGGSSLYTNSGATATQIVSDSNYTFGTGDFTIEAWVYLEDDANGYVWAHGTSFSDASNIRLLNIASTDKWQLRLGATNYDPSATVSFNTWTHLALVRTSGTVNFYVDGVKDTTIGSSGNVTFSTDLQSRPMALANLSYANVAPWQGYIDEFRISDVARYTANFTPSTEQFVADANTITLLHMDGANASTVFKDAIDGRKKVGVTALGNTQVDTAQSKIGGASALFDGSGDGLVAVPATKSDFTFDGDFTFEFWYNPVTDTGDASASLLSAKQTSSASDPNQWFILHRNFDNKLQVSLPSAGAESFPSASSSAITNNTWNHIALARSGSTVTLYLNGVSQGSKTNAADFGHPTNGNNEIGIGCFPDGALPFNQGGNGYIDEVRLSTTARYTSGFTPSTTPFVNDDDTVLLLHMDGTDGIQDFQDDNGVGRARVGVSAIGNAQVDTADSKFGGASALFDGSSDALYARVGDTPYVDIGTGDVTFECWFNKDSDKSLFDARVSTNTNVPLVQVVLGQVKLWWNNAYAIEHPTSISTGTWYHTALVRSSGVWEIYVNGVASGSPYTPTTDDFPPSNTEIFRIGINQPGSNSMDGHIDEFRISNTARYTTGFTPSTTPFVNDDNTLLLLHMDGTDGSTTFIDDNGVTPNHDYGA